MTLSLPFEAGASYEQGTSFGLSNEDSTQVSDQDPEVRELYEVSREIVAPVIAGFAHYVLEAAGARKIIFAARDGLGPYVAGQELKDRFDYPEGIDGQLVYAYLTRKIMYNNSASEISRYLRQHSVQPQDDVLLADIGMYGTFLPTLETILPRVNVHYLISRNPEVPGYADDLHNRRMNSMTHIVGNTAVHFLEDTYSGFIPSPTRLVEADGQLVPDTLGESYLPHIRTKRQAAIRAIIDYTRDLDDVPPNPDLTAISHLDEFLSESARYTHLMVPHER